MRDEIRRAYVARARRYHPDQQGDPARMQAVNEAWRVLGDGRLRSEYDRSRRRPPIPPVGPSVDTVFRDIDDAPAPDTIRGTPVQLALRVMPWVVIALVILGIFVFSAYARTDTSDPAGGQGWLRPGVCILVSGEAVIEVSCETPNDGLVVQDVVGPDGCRDDNAQAVEIVGAGRRVCLVDTLATRG
jgi:hypothetical protein